MGRCVIFENGNKTNTCLKECSLHNQNVLNILGSIDDVIGGDMYDQIMSTGIFVFILNEILNVNS